MSFRLFRLFLYGSWRWIFYCVICRRSKINCYFEIQDCRVYEEFFSIFIEYFYLSQIVYRFIKILSSLFFYFDCYSYHTSTELNTLLIWEIFQYNNYVTVEI